MRCLAIILFLATALTASAVTRTGTNDFSGPISNGVANVVLINNAIATNSPVTLGQINSGLLPLATSNFVKGLISGANLLSNGVITIGGQIVTNGGAYAGGGGGGALAASNNTSIQAGTISLTTSNGTNWLVVGNAPVPTNTFAAAGPGLTVSTAGGVIYTLSTNGWTRFLTSETDPFFTAWLGTNTYIKSLASLGLAGVLSNGSYAANGQSISNLLNLVALQVLVTNASLVGTMSLRNHAGNAVIQLSADEVWVPDPVYQFGAVNLETLNAAILTATNEFDPIFTAWLGTNTYQVSKLTTGLLVTASGSLTVNGGASTVLTNGGPLVIANTYSPPAGSTVLSNGTVNLAGTLVSNGTVLAVILTNGLFATGQGSITVFAGGATFNFGSAPNLAPYFLSATTNTLTLGAAANAGNLISTGVLIGAKDTTSSYSVTLSNPVAKVEFRSVNSNLVATINGGTASNIMLGGLNIGAGLTTVTNSDGTLSVSNTPTASIIGIAGGITNNQTSMVTLGGGITVVGNSTISYAGILNVGTLNAVNFIGGGVTGSVNSVNGLQSNITIAAGMGGTISVSGQTLTVNPGTVNIASNAIWSTTSQASSNGIVLEYTIRTATQVFGNASSGYQLINYTYPLTNQSSWFDGTNLVAKIAPCNITVVCNFTLTEGGVVTAPDRYIFYAISTSGSTNKLGANDNSALQGSSSFMTWSSSFDISNTTESWQFKIQMIDNSGTFGSDSTNPQNTVNRIRIIARGTK